MTMLTTPASPRASRAARSTSRAARSTSRAALPPLDRFGTRPIVAAITAETYAAWANAGVVFDRAGELRLILDAGHALTVADLRLAQRRGQRCPSYTVRPAAGTAADRRAMEPGDRYSVVNLVTLHGSAAALRDVLAALPWETVGSFGSFRALAWTFDGREWDVTRSDTDAVRVFSPLHLDRFAPLATVPAKWTAAHVVRALVHGQLGAVTRAYRYSDDYAGDAAANFGQGAASALELAQRLCTSPSGWWFRQEVGKNGRAQVSANCHHHESLDAVLDLDASPTWATPLAGTPAAETPAQAHPVA